MLEESQISAVVASTTRNLLEQYARATGIKKGRLIEDALLHHIHALQSLPGDVIVPPRLVVSRRSGAQVARRIAARPKPTRQLQTLLSGDGD
jgi:hypothetical protein